jgi:hypothetical protein
MLKGETKNYYIKKLKVIIGWKLKKPNCPVKYLVDINLGLNKKVSKQHALILYNF